MRSRLRWAGRRKVDSDDPQQLMEEIEFRDRHLQESQSTIEALRRELADRDAELDALRGISEATGSAFGSETMLNGIAEIAERITNTENCHIYLFNEDKSKLILRAASESDRHWVKQIMIEVGEGITGWVARERRHVACSRQAYNDHRFKFFPDLHERDYESFLSVPLIYKNEIIGVINVRTREPREYSKHQVRLLSGIANQVAGAIDHMRQYRRLEAQATQLTTLSEVSKTITSNMYLEEILQLLVSMTAQTLNYKICTVMLLDEEKQELVIKATQAQSPAYLAKPNLKVGESIAGRAVERETVITVRDLSKSDEFHFGPLAEKEGLVSMAAVPLKLKNKVLGVLNCYTEKAHHFTEVEIDTLEALANQAAIAIEHAKLMVRSAILQEMHHRVKNNLQQVASLLRLQLHYAKYTTLEEAINDSLSRILAIASVHELLSREDLDLVSVKKVASSILHHTHQGLVPPDKSIQTTVSGDDVMLPLDKATSVALALNELIMNALEHGFRDLDNGSINVIVVNAGTSVTIRVENNGTPLPEGFDPSTTQNMGLRIVDTLTRESLVGRFEMANRERITATLEFPIAG